jgi:hypothetical protein
MDLGLGSTLPLLQALKEESPLVAYGARVLLVLRLQLFDVAGIRALKE